MLGAGAVQAAQTNEQKCRLRRLKLASKHAACVEKVLTLTSGSESTGVFKCRKRYVSSYGKLQKLAGSPCALPRFVDNADGTITDNLTGLQWEKKTDDSTVHDKDNSYQ